MKGTRWYLACLMLISTFSTSPSATSALCLLIDPSASVTPSTLTLSTMHGKEAGLGQHEGRVGQVIVMQTNLLHDNLMA